MANVERRPTDELHQQHDAGSKLHRNDPHVEAFKRNVNIKIHILDLASVKSVLTFSDEIKRECVSLVRLSWFYLTISTRYPYVSHVVCNAGVAAMLRINWFGLAKQLIMDTVGAFTWPEFNIQEVGITSEDGLGWVWQCNVFGHYVLVSVNEFAI